MDEIDKREKTYTDCGEVYKRLTVEEAVEAVKVHGELKNYHSPFAIGTVFGKVEYGEREPILDLYYLGLAHGMNESDKVHCGRSNIDIEMFMGYEDAETAEDNRPDGMIITYDYDTKLYGLTAKIEL